MFRRPFPKEETMKPKTLILVGLSVLILRMPAFAEPGAEGPLPGGEMPQPGDEAARGREGWGRLAQELQDKGFNRDKIREIMAKKRNGQALTAEEEEVAGKVERMQREMGARFGGADRQGGQRGFPGMAGMAASQLVKVKMNPLDAAYHAMAEACFAAQKYVEAVDALKIMVEKSPDPDTKNVAHFNAAQVYRHGLKYNSHAAEEYLKVKGTLRDRALREMVEMYQQSNDAQLAVDTLTQLANSTQEVGDKVGILRALAYAYSRMGKHDEAIETLKKIPALITYEQAVEMKEHYTPGDPPEVLEGRAPAMPPMMMQWQGRGQGRFGAGGAGGFGRGRGGQDQPVGQPLPEGKPADKPVEKPVEQPVEH
jgi:SOS response regulatory protein OraA/RecX